MYDYIYNILYTYMYIEAHIVYIVSALTWNLTAPYRHCVLIHCIWRL